MGRGSRDYQNLRFREGEGKVLATRADSLARGSSYIFYAEVQSQFSGRRNSARLGPGVFSPFEPTPSLSNISPVPSSRNTLLRQGKGKRHLQINSLSFLSSFSGFYFIFLSLPTFYLLKHSRESTYITLPPIFCFIARHNGR